MTSRPSQSSDERAPPPRGTKVVVAMSGGVDSSVAAALLQHEGYDVIGCFMRLGSVEERDEQELRANAACAVGGATAAAAQGASRTLAQVPRAAKAHKQGCCSVNDAADARLVAAHLGIPFYAVNFERDFGRVIDYFVSEYNEGRTPNPCVRCNDWLKFGRLHALARDLGAEFVASGHYARVERGGGSADGAGSRNPSIGDAAGGPAAGGRTRLLRGVDHSKDQSYVLFGTPRERLDEMLLPIGGLAKSRVRELAHEWGLPVFDKPDSQEICFVPDNDYAALVARRSPEPMREGEILDEAGRAIGTHAGHQHFTIGQRRGVPVALGTPVHVIAKDPRANTITVGPRARLLRSRCTARQTNWLIDPPGDFVECIARVRSNMVPAPARVRAVGGSEPALEVEFVEPVEAVVQGQAVVCYRGDELIGGGWIDSAA